MTERQRTPNELLADVVCGQRDPSDPLFRAAVTRDPGLLDQLADLQTLERQIAQVDRDAEQVVRTARAEAAADDRQRVVSSMPDHWPRRRQKRWPAVAAAAVLVAVGCALWFGLRSPVVDGRLGEHSGVNVMRTPAGLRAEFDGQLPAGAVYHLRLVLSDAVGDRSLEWDTAENPCLLPPEWIVAVDSSTDARLLVFVRDQASTAVEAVRVYRFKPN